MSCDVDLRRKVLQTTLDEVTHTTASYSNPCVICLEQVQDAGIAIPCKHGNFDFVCLVSWLEQRRTCPLCQAEVTGVKYDFQSPTGPKLYCLPSLPELVAPAVSNNPYSDQRPWSRPGRRSRGREPASAQSPEQLDHPLACRRYVYRQGLYSQRVGTNRLSQYRELTPQSFNRNETLATRARKWIRRELQVFAFLDVNNQDIERRAQDGNNHDAIGRTRRARNAEYLLEYIIAILRTVDIKGSGGQAEDLLQEFIGRDNARLFLHELQAWLRSPFNSLHDWDRAVQYNEHTEQSPPTIHRDEGEIRRTNRDRPKSCISGGQPDESRVGKSRLRGRRQGSVITRRAERARRLHLDQ